MILLPADGSVFITSPLSYLSLASFSVVDFTVNPFPNKISSASATLNPLTSGTLIFGTFVIVGIMGYRCNRGGIV